MNILFVVSDIEHLGIMSLSSVLKKAGHNVDIVWAIYDKVRRKLKDTNYAIIAYSAYSFNISHYLRLNRKIKEEHDIFSVFGGVHPTYSPEVIQEPGVDGVCIGEGDYALLDLVSNLKEGRSIANIANWWIKQDGTIFRNPPRPIVQNLDSLPFPDRTLFPNFYSISIATSRGCSYQCAFCQSSFQFRRRSVDSAIAELNEARSKGPLRFVSFVDSTFNLSTSWLQEFSEKYKNTIGVPFFCNLRANLVTTKDIQYLKKSGCWSVCIGIETANEYLNNTILKKGISQEQILSAAKIIKQHKIKLKTSNIIGIPFGTIEDDLETLRLNIRCRPVHASASLLCVYKNTGLYNVLVNNQPFHHKIFARERYIFLDAYGFTPTARKIRNLHKLFSFIVKFSFFSPLVPFLIQLPLRRVYTCIYVIWRGLAYFLIYGGSFASKKKLIRGSVRYLNMLKWHMNANMKIT